MPLALNGTPLRGSAILAGLEDSLGLLVSLRPRRTGSAGNPARRDRVELRPIESTGAAALVLEAPVLDALQEAVDHTLLRLTMPSAPVPRYAMLGTVREFAAEQLRATPEADAVHAAHVEQFRRLAHVRREATRRLLTHCSSAV